MNGETIRSFIAIELPAELVVRMKSYQSGLSASRLRFVKWVDPGSIHLTLKFLGNVDAKRIEAVKGALEAVAALHRSFQLTTGRTGFFPGPQRARVFWLGLEGDIVELSGLQQGIDRAMAALGFESESRPFTAHLTLARLREECSREQRLEFTGLAEHAAFGAGPPIKVRSVSLMRSRLTPQGAVYTRLAEYELNAV
ncbi:MAG: RNA 2',3'-cyclic phosphodiesterase [Dehalococcoidia bacterium]|nr:RNA 2',3'-cyclic phosphodiesterase [Dehalococcoidia bacterium]